ncbi:hypothetical protein Aperf_G00000050311 [Anoplocephala perfoliata]
MASDSEDELELFLKCVDLTDYEEKLKEKGIRSFKDLKTTKDAVLKTFLPRPVVKRIVRKRNKFDKHVIKKSKYPPLSEFLAELNLAHIQDDLKTKLQITRVEHLKDFTKEDLLEVVSEEDAKRIMVAYVKKKSPIARFIADKEEAVMKFGKKVCKYLDPSKVATIKRPSVLKTTITAPQPDLDQVARNVSIPAFSETEESQPIDMLPSEQQSQTQLEGSQLYEADNDETTTATTLPNSPDSDTSVNSLSLVYDDSSNVPPEQTSTTTAPQPGLEQSPGAVSIPIVTATEESQPIVMPPSEQPSQTPMDTKASASPNPSESDTSDGSSSTSSDDWYMFTESELNEAMEQWKLQENLFQSSPPLASKCSIVGITNCSKRVECGEDSSDSYVMDYFLSAREEDAFQYFDDVNIEETDINQVRTNLTHLEDLSDDDICDALRFVHAEQLSSHSFFDGFPPAEMKSDELSEWHYVQAARVLALRQIYAIATHLNFEECCDALRYCDWNFADALEITLT